MNVEQLIEKARKLVDSFRVTSSKRFRLRNIDPGDTLGIGSEEKSRAKEALTYGIETLAALQDKLYAQDKWAALVVLQGLDAGGKDGVIKHVMSGVNPQGCQVHSFKSPSAEDLDHDYLWRYIKCLPNRGHIGIFNRSYYEETLVVRVHPEILAKQRIPSPLVTKNIWKERFHDIRAFEAYLSRNGIVPMKFFLHLSKGEQRRRLLERIEMPEKNWKFSASDMAERARWDDYQEAFEDMIRNTATKECPWYVVPADNKWFAHGIVAAAIIERLGSLDLAYPRVDKVKLREIAGAKRALLKAK